MRALGAIVLLGVVALAGAARMAWTESRAVQAPALYDLVIAGGTVVDGTGRPAFAADVAVKAGRIAAVGRVDRSAAREVIEARGLTVAPGFIDVHTHADDLAQHPRADNFVRMGVTTIVAGNCGGSALDVGESLGEVRDTGASVNYATLIGHNTVRRAVMGTANRDPSVAELARMKSLVWRAMTDGAVGFSSGLQYVPGTYSHTPEIIELARIAGNAGGVYATHMRNEGTELEQSIEEAIRIGNAGACRVQISHLKVDSPARWGASARALAMIDAARARGIDVEADQYSYTAASSTLGIRFPSWALEGGQIAIAARLNDPATWARIRTDMRAMLAERGIEDLSFAVVSSYEPDPSFNGLSIKQIAAKTKGSDTLDAQLEVARGMLAAGGASMVYHLMSDQDVDLIMKHPQVGIASDASLLTPGEGVPHPRGYGNTVRVLGEYVRTRKVISLEEAVRKMTSLPAAQFRFEGRGQIKPGYAADLVLFDAATVGDRATFDKPHAFPAGVPYVFVNGIAVVRSDEHTGARPGQVLTLKAVSR